ncbi:MAG TPA: hypothetical protein VK616_07620 [Flavitalea sp.]|nr:hypothetical protein [Flavitalea sp.]
MQKIFPLLIIIYSSTLSVSAGAQTLSMSNKPSQTSSRNGIETGPFVFGVFVGRIPCQELMTDLNTPVIKECTKRKVGLTLYHDSVTHKPTTYKTFGMGKWSGKGKWHILHGTPTDPSATVFQLELDVKTSLFFLKADDNVLFILDRNRNFLIGNADYSYTLNRAEN